MRGTPLEMESGDLSFDERKTNPMHSERGSSLNSDMSDIIPGAKRNTVIGQGLLDSVIVSNKASGLNFGILPYVHMIMFGNGDPAYWYIPFCQGILMSVSLFYGAVRSLANNSWVSAGHEFSYIIELWANLYFGYEWLNAKQLEHVLYSSVSSERQQDFLYKLQIIFIVAYSLSWLNIAWYFAPKEKVSDGDDAITSFEILDIPTNLLFQYMVTINYYLCGVWCWLIWMKYEVFKREIRPLIALDTLSQFRDSFLIFNKQTELHSKTWRVNHIIRTLTGLYIVVANMIGAFDHYANREFFWASEASTFIITYYGSIWMTYLGAAMINHKVKKLMLMTLANLKTVTNEQKREVTELLTRFYHLFGGIYVSGLQMTTEGVLGAGSTILSIMMLLVKMHLGDKQAV
jgi:hypothetical protein